MSNSNIDKLFERVGTTWSDFYDVHTLSEDEPDIECIHLTDKAKQAIQQELLKARIDELEHIEDKHKVRLWFDGFYGVDDRITNLQAKLKGEE